MAHSLPGDKCVTTWVGSETVLFNFVKDLKEEMECTSNLQIASDFREPFKDILERLAEWASKNLMKLKNKCKVFHLGRISPCNSKGWALLIWRGALWKRP